MSKNLPRSSRQRYRGFVEDYKHGRLDDSTDAKDGRKPIADPAKTDGDVPAPAPAAEERGLLRGKRREYLREYLRWLAPYRWAVAAVFLFALTTAGLQMIEPLFMRYIIDRVLLNDALDVAARLTRLHMAGAAFLGVIIISNLVGVLKDYRQRLLNVKVMLSLRRALFDRMQIGRAHV